MYSVRIPYAIGLSDLVPDIGTRAPRPPETRPPTSSETMSSMPPAAPSDDEPARSGRRRDPRIEPVVLQAAMEVYAYGGWRGFNFDSVARTSGVGKPAIYRRWTDRADLLVSTFENANFPMAGDHGSLESDLREYAKSWVRWFQTPHLPRAGVLILADSTAHPELNEPYQNRVMRPRVAAVRSVTRRAIERGELPEDTPVTTIPELLLGAFFMHWSFADRHDDEFRAALQAFADHTIASILVGITRQPGSADPNDPTTDRVSDS